MKDTNNQKLYIGKDLKNIENSNINSHKERDLSNIFVLQNAFHHMLLRMKLTKSRKFNKLLSNDNINNKQENNELYITL